MTAASSTSLALSIEGFQSKSCSFSEQVSAADATESGSLKAGESPERFSFPILGTMLIDGIGQLLDQSGLGSLDLARSTALRTGIEVRASEGQVVLAARIDQATKEDGSLFTITVFGQGPILGLHQILDYVPLVASRSLLGHGIFFQRIEGATREVALRDVVATVRHLSGGAIQNRSTCESDLTDEPVSLHTRDPILGHTEVIENSVDA